MTRIVIDIAKAFNENFSRFNITAISPSYSYLMYRAGMQVLLTADVNNEKALQGFYKLRRCYWYFSHRWLITSSFPILRISSIEIKTNPLPGTYLDTLETCAQALEMNLLYLNKFVKPNTQLSSSC